MRINADFNRRAAVVPGDADWIRSPESGVDRLMLDRIGDEVARATSIVRYAPGSSFSRHEHAEGEEFLVLDGVFSDESGDYPAGSYVRNPPGSSHAPFSAGGCRILVKLRQFDAEDLAQFAVDTTFADAWRDGAGELTLHEFGSERVRMRRLDPGQPFEVLANDRGTEIFVVDGELDWEGDGYPSESWLRFPAGDEVRLLAAARTSVWVKTGHLADLA